MLRILIFIPPVQFIKLKKINRIKMYKYLLLILCSIWNCFSQSSCAVQCHMYYNGTHYVLGCTGQSENDCSQCDPEFFQFDGTHCVQLNDTIYNSTYQIQPADGWSRNTTSAVVSIYSSISYWRFSGQALVYLTYSIPAAHYAIRLRIWSYSSSSSNSLYIRVDDNQYIIQDPYPNAPVTWNHNIEQLAHTSDTLQLTFKRNDSYSYYLGFGTILLFVAECMQGCTSCTQLATCEACTGAYYYYNVTQTCVTSCPIGSFISATPNLCELCEKECLQCSDSVTCTICEDSGRYESFLLNDTCYAVCPNGYHPDQSTHTCTCPTGYYEEMGTCYGCAKECVSCWAGTKNDCDECALGYYLSNTSTTCQSTCPTGQYYDITEQSQQCYTCNTQCSSCVNKSSICTSCTSLYLYNHTCISNCPDGYERNNTSMVCSSCGIDLYSYEQVCVSQCEGYWVESVELRACVLPDGYPLQMEVEAKEDGVVSLLVQFTDGIDTDNLTYLQSNTATAITVTLEQDSTFTVVQSSLTIDSVTFSSNIMKINLPVSTESLLPTSTIKLTFNIPIYSTNKIIYSHNFSYPISEHPQILSSLYSLTTNLLYLIAIPFLTIPLIFLLFNIKHTLFSWLQYLHAQQLIGLMLYVGFPNNLDLELWSFLKGFSFSHGTFIWSITYQLIQPCSNCVGWSGYLFILGDMSYIRMMGVVVEVLCGVGFVIVILWQIPQTKQFAQHILWLLLALVYIKCIHSWWVSIIGIVLNPNLVAGDDDYLMLGGHFLSLVIFGVIVYEQVKWKEKHGGICCRKVGLALEVGLIAIMPIAPSMLGVIFCVTVVAEWVLMHSWNVDDMGVAHQDPIIYTNHQVFHRELLLSIKPIFSLIILLIPLATTEIVIIVTTIILFIYLVFLCVDTILQYNNNKKPIVPQALPHNATEQNIQKQEQKEEKSQTVLSDDDEVVAKKFKKKYKIHDNLEIKNL